MDMEIPYSDPFTPLVGDLFSELGEFPILDQKNALLWSNDDTKLVQVAAQTSPANSNGTNEWAHDGGHIHQLDEGWLDTKVDLFDLLGEDLLSDPFQIEVSPVADSVNPVVLSTLEIVSQQTVKDLQEIVHSNESESDTALCEGGPEETASCILDLLSNGYEFADLNVSDVNSGIFSSPMSPEDVESILSSPPSPISCHSPLSDASYSPQSDVCDEDYQIGPIRTKKGRSSASKSNRTVDKKVRKMEQNKAAALRYRQKKRAEGEHVNVELEHLQTKNDGLQKKVESMTREIQYLKDLMAEVFEARKKSS